MSDKDLSALTEAELLVEACDVILHNTRKIAEVFHGVQMLVRHDNALAPTAESFLYGSAFKAMDETGSVLHGMECVDDRDDWTAAIFDEVNRRRAERLQPFVQGADSWG